MAARAITWLCRLTLGVACLFVTDCATQPPAPGLRTFPLQGEVTLVIPATHRVVISHGKIEGWSGASNFEYPVRDEAAFAKLVVGDQITATIFVQNSEYWIGQINVIRKP